VSRISKRELKELFSFVSQGGEMALRISKRELKDQRSKLIPELHGFPRISKRELKVVSPIP